MGEQLSPEVLAIHQWIRDDAPVTIQMTITPTLISLLAERLKAARSQGHNAEQKAKTAHCSPTGESPEPCFECGSTERIGTACKPCNPELALPDDPIAELEGVISDLESSGWARAPGCVKTLKRVASVIATSPPPPKGAGKEDGSSQGLGGHPCGERNGAETERTAALATELALALEIIEALTDEDPCRLDHNGDCQAHAAFGEGDCPHAMAKVWLSRYVDKFADGSEANP